MITHIYEGYFNSVEQEVNADDYNQIGNNGGFYVWCFSFEPLVGQREDRLFVNEIPWNKVFLRLKQIANDFSFCDDAEITVNIHCGKYSKTFGDKELPYNLIDEFTVSVLDAQVDKANNHQIDLQAIYAIKFHCTGIDDIGGFKRDIIRLRQWLDTTWNYYDSIDSHGRTVTCQFSNILQYCSGNEDDINSWKEVLSRWRRNMASRYIAKLYDVFNQNGSLGENDSDPEPSEQGRRISDNAVNRDAYYDYPRYCSKLVKFLKRQNGILDEDERLVWTGIKEKNTKVSRYEDRQDEHLKMIFYLDTDKKLNGQETANKIYEQCFSGMNIHQKLELSMNGKRVNTIIDVFVITDLKVDCSQTFYSYTQHINLEHCKITFRIFFVSPKHQSWFDNETNEDLDDVPTMMNDSDIYKVKDNVIDVPF